MRDGLLLVVVAARTSSTLATWATWAFLIALGFRLQHAVRELILARLGVNLHQLHLDFVALMQAGILHGVQTIPVDFRDMQQTILARHNLDEASVRHD